MHKWTKAQQKIIEYIKSHSGVFNSTSLKHYIETETGITISKQNIASFLRSSLGLSYKRVASRQTKSSIPETKLKKIIFWFEFANLIKPEHKLVNIDESLFSRSTKINYSWTMKGVEASVTNSTLMDHYHSWLQLPTEETGTYRIFFQETTPIIYFLYWKLLNMDTKWPLYWGF